MTTTHVVKIGQSELLKFLRHGFDIGERQDTRHRNPQSCECLKRDRIGDSTDRGDHSDPSRTVDPLGAEKVTVSETKPEPTRQEPVLNDISNRCCNFIVGFDANRQISFADLNTSHISSLIGLVTSRVRNAGAAVIRYVATAPALTQGGAI